MEICSRCGKEFDPEVEVVEFEQECPLHNYENFTETLCAACAIDIIDSEESGPYFEYCEECGQKFDPFAAKVEFDMRRPGPNYDGFDDWSFGRTLCCDCVMVNWEEAQSEESFDSENDSEGISVFEAAQIWLSNGKDEDYMFGYSEEELEEALR